MRSLILSLSLCLLLTLPAVAKAPKQWYARFDKADAALKKGKWERALAIIDSNLKDMCDRIEGGPGVANLLAMATFLRAVGEAGAGRDDLATFDYVLAQRLVPAASQIDLELYGAKVAALLSPFNLESEPDSAATEVHETEPDQEDRSEEVEPPRKKHAPPPKFPYAKSLGCAEGPVVVESIIDTEGIPRWPDLATPQEPLLSFVAMDSLRHWRFEPARLDGEPVEVHFHLTVNFIPSCGNW